MLKKISVLLFSLFLFACDNPTTSTNQNQSESKQNKIKIGIITGPEEEVTKVAANIAKQKFNLDVELVTFNDYVMPNEALNAGEIDLNSFQHVPYIEKQIAERGYKLAVVGYTFVYPLAGYSKKIKDISEIKDGSTITIPNDPTNQARALLLLQKYNLLKLKNDGNLNSTVLDIEENPRNFIIVDVEAPMLTHTLDDKEVSLSIINGTYASKVGLSAKKDGILIEDKDSAYNNIIASRKGDESKEFAKQFLQSYQSDEVVKKAEEVFQGSAVKGW